VSTADWREEYQDIEDDKAHQEPPVMEAADKSLERRPEVNMSELLRHAKVKETKLQDGYEFLNPPASKVIAEADDTEKQVVTPIDDWVDLKEEISVPRRKEYAKVVVGESEKSQS